MLYKWNRRISLTQPAAPRIPPKSICISLSTKALLKRWRSAQTRRTAAHEQIRVKPHSVEAQAKIFRSRIYSGVPKLFAYMFDAPHATLITANGLCSDLDNTLLHPIEQAVLYMFIFIITGKLPKRLR